MTGFHKREISKLQEQLDDVRQDHQRWLEQQDKEAQAWNDERAQFKEKIHQLDLSLQDAKNKNRQQQDDYEAKLSEKNLRIAGLQGQLD